MSANQQRKQTMSLNKGIVGRPLDRLRHKPRPPALERGPRHDAVLNGKQPEQQCVDDQCRNKRPGYAAVDGFGYRQIANEGDRVQDRAKK